MPDDAKQAWSEVAEKFSSWGQRVASRYQDAEADDPRSRDELRSEFTREAKEVVDELARGLTALGATLRDDEANKELGQAVSAIGDAITATVNEAAEGVRSGRQ